MKEISFKNSSLKAMVDDEDYCDVAQYDWTLRKCEHTSYAVRRKNRKGVRLHRYIMKPADGLLIDHINGNGLDNRRANLRVCTHAENARNRRTARNNKCGYKGVRLLTGYDKIWRVTIKANNKNFHIGYFNKLNDAARAYNEAALKHHGEFAKLNIIKEDII